MGDEKSVKRSANRRKAEDRTPLDAYYTDDNLAALLVGLLPMQAGQTAIEPSVGGGAFARALAAAGLHVAGIDIDPAARGLEDCREARVADWADVTPTGQADWIVGNPPYAHAQAHIEHALRHGANVAMLLRLAFLESRKREAFWRRHPAHAIWTITPRPRFSGAKTTDSAAYGWFWWQSRAEVPVHGNVTEPMTLRNLYYHTK